MDAGAVLTAITLLLSPCQPEAGPRVPEVYVRAAHRAVRVHWPYQRQYLWCALVAQAGAESGWEADAVSPVGAEGPWQVMPGTWIEHTMRHGFSGSPFDPWVAAHVAAIHMETQARIWSAPRSDACRLELQVASYNAGAQRIIDAQRLAGGAPCWPAIAPELTDVTGRHATETRDYVARWRRILSRLWRVEVVEASE